MGVCLVLYWWGVLGFVECKEIAYHDCAGRRSLAQRKAKLAATTSPRGREAEAHKKATPLGIRPTCPDSAEKKEDKLPVNSPSLPACDISHPLTGLGRHAGSGAWMDGLESVSTSLTNFRPV